MAYSLLEYGADFEKLENSFKKTAKELTTSSPSLFQAYEALCIKVEKEKLSRLIPDHNYINNNNAINEFNNSSYINKI